MNIVHRPESRMRLRSPYRSFPIRPLPGYIVTMRYALDGLVLNYAAEIQNWGAGRYGPPHVFDRITKIAQGTTCLRELCFAALHKLRRSPAYLLSRGYWIRYRIGVVHAWAAGDPEWEAYLRTLHQEMCTGSGEEQWIFTHRESQDEVCRRLKLGLFEQRELTNMKVEVVKQGDDHHFFSHELAHG